MAGKNRYQSNDDLEDLGLDKGTPQTEVNVEEGEVNQPVVIKGSLEVTEEPREEGPTFPATIQSNDIMNTPPDDVEVKNVAEFVIADMVAKTKELEKELVITIPANEASQNIITKEKNMENFYVPKNTKAEKALTKETIKKVDSLNLEDILKEELTGTGKSEVTGIIDVHVSTEAMKAAIIRVLNSVKGKVKLEKKEVIENGIASQKDIFDIFIEGIEGISSQLMYDATRAAMTVSNFHKEATNKIMAEVPNISAAVATAEAEKLVTAYVGKSVYELKNAAASLPVKLLTLVVKRSAIPRVNGKDDKVGIDLICNEFASEYVKSVIADGEYLHIGINLSKMFKYAQGHFLVADLENIKMISATIVSNSASVNQIVYRIEKK